MIPMSKSIELLGYWSWRRSHNFLFLLLLLFLLRFRLLHTGVAPSAPVMRMALPPFVTMVVTFGMTMMTMFEKSMPMD